MDSVSTAFELMRLELEAEVDDLNAKGAELFHASEYEQASVLTAKGLALKEFCEKAKRLSEEWMDSFAEEFPENVVPEEFEKAKRSILSNSKSSKTILLVQFRDGSIISEKTAADTLARTIQRIGFERVQKLNILVNNENIVSKQASSFYSDKVLDGYFIKTHSNTQQKLRNLEEISNTLGLGLRVQIVSPYSFQES